MFPTNIIRFPNWEFIKPYLVRERTVNVHCSKGIITDDCVLSVGQGRGREVVAAPRGGG